MSHFAIKKGEQVKIGFIPYVAPPSVAISRETHIETKGDYLVRG
jgi:hypothetical protein